MNTQHNLPFFNPTPLHAFSSLPLSFLFPHRSVENSMLQSMTMTDPRDALMIGRTIKTTRITVLRAEPCKGKDWWETSLW